MKLPDILRQGFSHGVAGAVAANLLLSACYFDGPLYGALYDLELASATVDGNRLSPASGSFVTPGVTWHWSHSLHALESEIHNRGDKAMTIRCHEGTLIDERGARLPLRCPEGIVAHEEPAQSVNGSNEVSISPGSKKKVSFFAAVSAEPWVDGDVRIQPLLPFVPGTRKKIWSGSRENVEALARQQESAELKLTLPLVRGGVTSMLEVAFRVREAHVKRHPY